MPRRYAAIITGPDTHLDHLGVLSYLLQIPLIVTEESVYLSARKFYPHIDVTLKTLHEMDLEFLAENYDVIFQSGKFWALELDMLLQLFYKKKMRFVYCPHGNSDKGYSLKTHVKQDVSLVYGSHMRDLLKNTGAQEQIKTLIETGNYRYPFYQKHRTFYDEILLSYLPNTFSRKKKTILYAPTWNSEETPSSFFSHCTQVIDELQNQFQIIVKLHPFLEEDHPAKTYAILNHYEKAPNVLFLSNFPAIYPLLSYCDIYLGDFSSIGYDFLAFDKPLYFFQGLVNQDSKASYLHQCGLEIPLKENLSQFIEQTLTDNMEQKREARKWVYEYAFGRERSLKEISRTILDSI